MCIDDKIDTIDFGYHYIDNTHRRKQAQSKEIAESLGLDLDDLEPPEMYVFRSPIILSNLINSMAKSSEFDENNNNNDNKDKNEKNTQKQKIYTLEDMGIYRISLESDVASMTQFVLQYSTPLIPKIDTNNFVDFCYLGYVSSSIHLAYFISLSFICVLSI